MSQFYDLASLVVIPSGYKASTIYAQKPLTTEGQLSFSRASTATRVNASGLIEAVASNVPRLDYLGSSCPRLLLEPQRTNLVTYSESFDDSSWTKAGTTITANDSTSPDGYTNADRLVETATTATHLVLRSVALTAGTYTFSCFIKAVSGSTRNVGLLFNLTGKGVIVNPSTGAVVLYSGTTAADVKIETYPNGWYRVAVTATAAAIIESLRIYLANGTTWVAPYAGDGTSSALIWGAQFEAGSYATSYIPTTSAAVTRVDDVASKTGISSLIGQTEGIIFAEFQKNVGLDAANMIFSLSDGTSSNLIYYNLVGGVVEILAGGVLVASKGGIVLQNGTNKIAICYKLNDFAIYLNGASIHTDTSGAVPTMSKLNVGNWFNESFPSGTPISQTLLFKTRLTNAQLAELTTL